MKLRIGMPYIERVGGMSRLKADIKLPDEKVKELYYEVDSQYESYLCTERSDAFVLSLLQYAMFHGYDIEWECPVTERLVYQLRTMYIPVLAEIASDQFSAIKLNGEVIKESIDKKMHGVATGASGGIDSFYTVMKHVNDVEASYKLTHLFYVAISNNVSSLEGLREDFEKGYKNIQNIAEALNLPVVKLFSNETEFHYSGIVNGGALRYAGMVYSLQKMFDIYYLSSGLRFVEFKLAKGDSHYYDLFNFTCVSTQSIQFYSTGGEAGRVEKTDYIAKFNVVQKNLHVCNFSEIDNCSKCDKCFRTMFPLYAEGMLENFGQKFDLLKFGKYKSKYMARLIYRKSIFDKEILNKFKKNNIAIPFSTRVRGILLRPAYLVWQKIQKNKFLMKIFYKNRLDYILYSKELADSIRYCNNVK